MKTSSISSRDTFLALAVMILWGFNFPILKIGVQNFPPLLFSALRFAIVFLLTIPFCKLEIRVIKSGFRASILLGLIHFMLFSWGMRSGSASTGAMLYQLNVPFGVLLSVLFLSESVSGVQRFGVGIAFLGALILLWKGQHDFDIRPSLLMIGAAAVSAVGQIEVKKNAKDLPPLVFNNALAMFSAVELLLASILFEDWHTLEIIHTASLTWIALLYVAICSGVLGYGIWWSLLQRNRVSVVMPFNLLTCVFSTIGSVLFLKESLGISTILGGLLIIIGVAGVLGCSPRRILRAFDLRNS
ncbi:DMT family transporter [Paraburkholderia caribensis]|uniref:DMT family transporter n=1 Tax=Paraburkholderia caribensis TaxID=75105 RepID=UPI00078D4897|nr:EamA family transporter [Paraburkholderia caribensis]AMV41760.1 hypothetical protein ATN79_03555 [Paraburkholderia caribensis]